MATFQHPRDFVGAYIGQHDGRNARLHITQIRGQHRHPTFNIVLSDLDRKVTFRGVHIHKNTQSGHAHILKDVTLNQVGNTGKKVYKFLLLHTWNTDYLTGVDIWNGREFGAGFERINA